jgi:hypothetical protein
MLRRFIAVATGVICACSCAVSQQTVQGQGAYESAQAELKTAAHASRGDAATNFVNMQKTLSAANALIAEGPSKRGNATVDAEIDRSRENFLKDTIVVLGLQIECAKEFGEGSAESAYKLARILGGEEAAAKLKATPLLSGEHVDPIKPFSDGLYASLTKQPVGQLGQPDDVPAAAASPAVTYPRFREQHHRIQQLSVYDAMTLQAWNTLVSERVMTKPGASAVGMIILNSIQAVPEDAYRTLVLQTSADILKFHDAEPANAVRLVELLLNVRTGGPGNKSSAKFVNQLLTETTLAKVNPAVSDEIGETITDFTKATLWHGGELR